MSSDEKIEKLSQKMDTRITLRAAKCGGGLHMKLPPTIVDQYNLETGDKIHVQFKSVRYCNVRMVSKI